MPLYLATVTVTAENSEGDRFEGEIKIMCPSVRNAFDAHDEMGRLTEYSEWVPKETEITLNEKDETLSQFTDEELIEYALSGYIDWQLEGEL